VCYATSQVDDEEEENMSMGAGPGTGIVQILRKSAIILWQHMDFSLS
jgi:hypothetical protein